LNEHQLNHLKRFAILTVQFYKLLAWYNIAFTLVGLALLRFAGLPINTAGFFCAKLMGLPVAISLYYFTAKQTLYYFRNAAFKARWLFLSALIPDLLLFSVAILINNIING